MTSFRILLLVLACGCASLATALSVRVSGASIYVNEIEVIKIHAAAGGRSPEQRAAYLGPLLEKDLEIDGIRLSAAGKSYRLVVGGKPWILVNDDEARAAKMSPKALALAWVSALRSALSLPGIKLPGDHMKAPVGGTRSVPMIGGLVRQSIVAVSDPKVVSVVREGAVLRVKGIGSGQAQAKISSGASSVCLNITVLPLAASLPQSLTAEVTGMPAARDTVSGAVVATVNNELKSVDGSQVAFQPPTVSDIPTGESRTYSVPVKVTGPMSYPASGIVSVTVRNEAISYRSEADLWYSNDPEPVKKPMSLFVAALKAGEPVRMLYHHINRSGSTLVMDVEAINNTNSPARVLIIPGDADPDQNPVAAGFEAGDRFVRAWSRYSGEVVDVPPFSILPISLRQMRRNDTVSGLCYLRLLEGGPAQLIVRAQAKLPSIVDDRVKLAMQSPTPWRISGCLQIGDLATVPQPDAIHIYPNPFKNESVSYNVGGPFCFVRIGQTPIARQDNRGALDGNFGVVYTIKANIENNTPKAAEIEVVYEASAGYGGAVFLINGDLRRTPLLQPKEEARLSTIRLEPNSSKLLQIQTVPLSGSAYPCTLTIRPVPVVRSNIEPRKS